MTRIHQPVLAAVSVLLLAACTTPASELEPANPSGQVQAQEGMATTEPAQLPEKMAMESPHTVELWRMWVLGRVRGASSMEHLQNTSKQEGYEGAGSSTLLFPADAQRRSLPVDFPFELQNQRSKNLIEFSCLGAGDATLLLTAPTIADTQMSVECTYPAKIYSLEFDARGAQQVHVQVRPGSQTKGLPTVTMYD